MPAGPQDAGGQGVLAGTHPSKNTWPRACRALGCWRPWDTSQGVASASLWRAGLSRSHWMLSRSVTEKSPSFWGLEWNSLDVQQGCRGPGGAGPHGRHAGVLPSRAEMSRGSLFVDAQSHWMSSRSVRKWGVNARARGSCRTPTVGCSSIHIGVRHCALLRRLYTGRPLGAQSVRQICGAH